MNEGESPPPPKFMSCEQFAEEKEKNILENYCHIIILSCFFFLSLHATPHLTPYMPPAADLKYLPSQYKLLLFLTRNVYFWVLVSVSQFTVLASVSWISFTLFYFVLGLLSSDLYTTRLSYLWDLSNWIWTFSPPLFFFFFHDV